MAYRPSLYLVLNPTFSFIDFFDSSGGSVWCDGSAPTYWVTGHDGHLIDRPMCLIDGEWVHPTNNFTALVRGPDRHACVTMDVNRDGLDDVLCNVGAGSGKGRGDNEVYLTEPNGSLTKLDVATAPHGLNMYPYMRNRVSVTLKNAGGVREFVFMGTLGAPRADGKSNLHRMYRNAYVSPSTFPYFKEVPGPWTRRYFITLHAEAGDFTGDGVDDLIVCDIDGPALLARQGNRGEFYGVNLPKNNKYVRSWRSVRLAEVTGDGRRDLVVVTWPNPNSSLWVFRGVRGSPYFDFVKPYFEASLRWYATDVEVLDVNGDGRRDVYVIQVDEGRGTYCERDGVLNLPPNVTPSRDNAHDLLFLGTRVSFRGVMMGHALPGCGYAAQRWDDRTMLLAQGSFDHPGFQLLLEW
jgi:FG-GAP-like repeat